MQSLCNFFLLPKFLNFTNTVHPKKSNYFYPHYTDHGGLNSAIFPEQEAYQNFTMTTCFSSRENITIKSAIVDIVGVEVIRFFLDERYWINSRISKNINTAL